MYKVYYIMQEVREPEGEHIKRTKAVKSDSFQDDQMQQHRRRRYAAPTLKKIESGIAWQKASSIGTQCFRIFARDNFARKKKRCSSPY